MPIGGDDQKFWLAHLPATPPSKQELIISCARAFTYWSLRISILNPTATSRTCASFFPNYKNLDRIEGSFPPSQIFRHPPRNTNPCHVDPPIVTWDLHIVLGGRATPSAARFSFSKSKKKG